VQALRSETDPVQRVRKLADLLQEASSTLASQIGSDRLSDDLIQAIVSALEAAHEDVMDVVHRAVVNRGS
jgi:hypothetical protein